MPVISSLQSGLKVNSTGNNQLTGEIGFGDVNGFFPIYATTAVTAQNITVGQLMSGGAYLTINPAAGVAGSFATLLAGQALTLAIEYNANNQFRFDVTTVGSKGISISSPWLAVGSEHSVGVSYDTTSGLTVLAVDGNAQSTFANYTTTGTVAPTAATVPNTFGTNSGVLQSAPTYNGYLDQLALFNSAPTAASLIAMTGDPVSTSASLIVGSTSSSVVGHIESQTVAPATVVTKATATAAAATLQLSTTGGLSGIQVGDVVSDATTSASIAAGTTVLNVDSTGLVTLSANAVASIPATDSIVFTHPTTAQLSTTAGGVVANSNVLTFAAAPKTVQIGDVVSGFDIPAGVTVTALGATTVTLSTAVGSSAPALADNLTFTHQPGNVSSTGVAATASATIGLTVNNAGIQLGDVVINTTAGIPANDHVIGIDANGTKLTLSQAVPIFAAGTALTFVHSNYTKSTAPATNIGVSTMTLGTANLAIQVGDIVTDITTPTATVNEVVTGVTATGSGITLSSGLPVAAVASDVLYFTHAASTTTTGSTTTTSTSYLTVANGNGVQVGDIVVDNTTPGNTAVTNTNVTVTGVNGNLLTLSAAISPTTTFTNDTLTFVHPPAVTPTSPANTTLIPPATSGNSVVVPGYQLASADSSTLYVNSTNGIQAGDYVFGTNIPVGDTVASTWVASATPTVTLKSATTLNVPTGTTVTFVHPNDPNIQIVTINTTSSGSSTTATSYVAGDSITITAPATANTFASASYTVASTDVGNTPTATLTNIAKSFANANPTIGAFYLIPGPANGQIELVPNNGTAQVLPLATVKATDSAGINENTITNYYNFSSTKTAGTTTTGAAGTTSAYKATTYDSSGVLANTTSVASVSYAAAATTSATPQAHGPVYLELASLNGLTATYNLFVDGNSVSNGVLNTAGLTINVPSNQGTITGIVPSSSGTVTQVNNTGTGVITYQWASNSGVTNFTAPIGQLTVNLTSNAINSLSATVTNMSVNNVNYMDPVQAKVPMLETSTLNSQVYTVSGHIFDQYNPGSNNYGLTNAGTAWGPYTTQKALPNTDFSYTVVSTAASDLKFVVEQNNLTPVTQTAPTSNLALDLFANSNPSAWSTAKAMPFTVTIDVPSNASGVNFTAGTGVTLTSSTASSGHTLTLSGTYSAPSGKGAVGSSAPMLGTLSATLSNEFNNGGQFAMDTVSINGNASVGQSLYFGMGEANAQGAYSISNLPAGSLKITPFNNVAQVNPSSINVNSVMAVMSIAAGKGMPAGVGQAIGTAANLLPSDFVAADYNQDGQVTAADALSMLNYIVSVNKTSTPGYTYMYATSNALVNTVESTTSVVTPALPTLATNLSKSGAVLVTGDSSNIVDIVGVLPGNVVNY